MSRIVITGLGVISAIGNSTQENRASLAAGKCGIGKLEMFPTKLAAHFPAGEIKISNEKLKEILEVKEEGVSRTTLLALHAFNEAVADSKLSDTELASELTALVGATTVGGMCLTDEMYSDSQPDTLPSPYLSAYDFGAATVFLQKRFSIGGVINEINTACSSGANAIMYGARLINSGRAKIAIVGGFDSLAKFTVNGFNALHILSDEQCTPFDEARKGLNLGEGAAFLVLEKEEDAAGKKIYAVLNGWANTNDAFHASSLSEEGEGPFLAMKGALSSAKLLPADIDFINAHGTGTENNDKVESIAMLRLFDKVPAFSSTKANTGHTLAAAGALEAVYCILSLAEQELYPAIFFKNAIQQTELKPLQAGGKVPLKNIMSNSFGFGGNCSSLIFSKA